ARNNLTVVTRNQRDFGHVPDSPSKTGRFESASANRDEVVVVEQCLHELRPGAAAGIGAHWIQRRPALERLFTRSQLVRRGGLAENPRERLPREVIPRSFFQPKRDLGGHGRGELAVDQRQGLLRDDALTAAIAIQWVGLVEGRQKLV